MFFLNNVPHLFEGIFIERTVLFAQGEETVAGDADELAQKLALGVTVAVPARAAVEEGGEVVLHLVVTPLLKRMNTLHEVVDKRFEDCFAADFVPHNLAQRDGRAATFCASCESVERVLIHVDADAGDGGSDALARELMFEEHAADFSVADVDIVGPFDGSSPSFSVRERARSCRERILDGVQYREGGNLGNHELLVSSGPMRPF